MEKGEPGKNTKDSGLDEDEIIELSDVVGQPEEDEIIELTASVDDDGIIELTDTAEASESDDDIIDLEEAVADDDVIELSDMAEEAESDDEVIELQDTLDADEPDDVIELIEPAAGSGGEPSAALDEEAPIELMDVSDDDADDVLEEEPIDLLEADELESEPDENSDETEKTLDLLDTLESDRISELTGEIGSANNMETEDQAQEEPIELASVEEPSVDIYDYEKEESPDTAEEDLIELNDIAEVIQAEDNEPDVVGTVAAKEDKIELDEQDIRDLEADLLDPDEEFDVTAEGSGSLDYELDHEFSQTLDADLGSVLTVSGKDEMAEVQQGGKKLDRPGVVTVQVNDNRTKGAPIDFKFESKVHPGDRFVRESDELFKGEGITPEQVEKTVEKVVRELLSEKIDQLLKGMIEKAVLSEIQKIKKALLEDIEVQDE